MFRSIQPPHLLEPGPSNGDTSGLQDVYFDDPLPSSPIGSGDRSQRYLMPVRLEFVHPTAAAVSVAGTFNLWRSNVAPMHRADDGRWLWETVLEPGRYEYCLVVDGQWRHDPLATDYVPNVFGGMNSILDCIG